MPKLVASNLSVDEFERLKAKDERPSFVPSVREVPPENCDVFPFEFFVSLTACRGRIFVPNGYSGDRVVILAHGLCCLQTFEPMNTLVRHLSAAGIACATFDYRNFGESDGGRRQLLHPRMLLEDWRAAVSAIASDPRFRNAAIGVWGTSFSGGHVIVTAANHRFDSPKGTLCRHTIHNVLNEPTY